MAAHTKKNIDDTPQQEETGDVNTKNTIKPEKKENNDRSLTNEKINDPVEKKPIKRKTKDIDNTSPEQEETGDVNTKNTIKPEIKENNDKGLTNEDINEPGEKKPIKRKTIIFIIIGVLLVGGAIFYFTRPPKVAKTSYLTTKVTRGDLNVTITSTGILNPDSNIAVGTQVSGIISKIFVDFNYKVKKHELLALIDTTPLKEAENDARASVEKANAQVFQTKKAFDRVKILLEGKAAAQVDYDVAESNYKTALADRLSAMAQYSKTKTNFGYAYIRAPIAGTVVSRNVDIGQTVAASFTTPTLFMIANDLKKMQVQAAVDETDIGQVVLGQDVVFLVDAYPNRKFTGKVTQIRLQPTVTNNVVNYAVIIQVPNPDLKLMPGMTANITFQVESHKNVLIIPSKALNFNPSTAEKTGKPDQSKPNNSQKPMKPKIPKDSAARKHGTVWVVSGDSLKRVKVTVGLTNGMQTEVTGDINEGDQVVTDISSAGNPDAATVKSPFAPTFGGRGTGGGGGGRRGN